MSTPAAGQGVKDGVGGPAPGRKLAHVRFPSMIGPTMSPRKPTGKPPGRRKGPERELLLVRLRPDQARALRELAARETDRGQLDVSGTLRRILDRALKLKPGEMP